MGYRALEQTRTLLKLKRNYKKQSQIQFKLVLYCPGYKARAVYPNTFLSFLAANNA